MSVANAIIFCLAAHMVGDYIMQNQWMASRKFDSWGVAILHGVTYTLPFLLVTLSPAALAIICVTHILIDHYKLARWVLWGKNQLAPRSQRYAMTANGNPESNPAWLAGWMTIIVDNILHMALNVLAVLYA